MRASGVSMLIQILLRLDYFLKARIQRLFIYIVEKLILGVF